MCICYKSRNKMIYSLLLLLLMQWIHIIDWTRNWSFKTRFCLFSFTVLLRSISLNDSLQYFITFTLLTICQKKKKKISLGDSCKVTAKDFKKISQYLLFKVSAKTFFIVFILLGSNSLLKKSPFEQRQRILAVKYQHLKVACWKRLCFSTLNLFLTFFS